MATVISCQRDDQLIIQDEHSKEKMDVQIKKYNFNTLSKQERFREAYDRVFVKNANSVGGLSKTIMEQDYGFTIDSSLIKEVTVQGYTSYTFLIHRDSIATNYFENLVVTIDSVNTTKAYIIKYTPNTPPVYIVEDDAYTLDAQKELTPINYNTNQAKLSFVDEDGCTIITLMCPFGDDGPHPATQVCINQDRGDLYWDYDSSNCDSSGGGGGTSGSGSDGSAGSGSDGSSGGGGGGGGTSGGSNDDGGLDTGCKGCGDTGGPIITDPVLEEEVDELQPCPGDPVKNIQLAPQLGASGWSGGLFGNSDINGCRRYGSNDCTTPRNKKHEGLDLINSFGDPIYAMYGGTVIQTQYQSSGLGYYTYIESVVNGETIQIAYGHMQSNELQVGAQVTQGQIIGFQGNSGNLATAIQNNMSVSHLHIKIKKDGVPIDPREYLGSYMDINGNVTPAECD